MRARGDYLTRRQREILDFIAEYQAFQGIAPTLREICGRFGYSSYGTAHKHLRLLQEKGYVQRDWNQKRGLTLLRSVGGSPRAAVELPFFGWIAAGSPFEAVTSGERLAVPEHLLRGPAGEHYVLRVVGSSMVEEGIHDGDLVVVRHRDEAEPGEMVVALLGDEATIKRFFPQGDTVRLQPANPNMEPLRVAAGDLKIQGVVVGLMRRF